MPNTSEHLQYNHTDSSYHETSFGGYVNFHGTHVQVSEGTINFEGNPRANDPCDLSKPLDKLRQHTSPSATFDAAERFDPPRCAKATREEIIRRIENWITDDGPNETTARLFWLYGGAGVGKSAIAQTLAEKLKREQNLAASFFFFKTDILRNDGHTLIPTLVSQLVDTFKGLGHFVEETIRERPDVFGKLCGTQIDELLVGPLVRLKKSFFPRLRSRSRPRLIVIDGLDECRNGEVQRTLLQAIASALPCIPYPLRFLVTSRPETHIVRAFDHDPTLQAIRYNLSDDPNASNDIRQFLEDEFGEIRRSHCLSPYLPAWPDQRSITLLVNRSSGHFIYAATVIRYIRSHKHRPDNRLNVILQLQQPQCQDKPYAELDALYSLIFQGIGGQDLEKICLVLGILYVRDHSDLSRWAPYSNCSTIEKILGMRAGDAILLLSPILSLVAINNEEVRILHKSLIDYLLDPTRCGHVSLPFDLARVHQSAATHILQENIMANHCTISEFANFAYHCRNGYLNESVKDYLRNLEVPYPKCVNTTLKDALLGMNRLNPLVTVAHFFRALGRDDFDSTGEYHKQYAAKWMKYLQSTIPETYHSQCSASSESSTVDSHGLNIKYQLDAMLKQWEPKEFKPAGARPISKRHEGFIQQEHLVWSALTRYRCSTSTAKSNIVSSLVFGKHFIYSYHLASEKHATTGNTTSFLFFTIYVRHENVCVNFDPQVSTHINKVIVDTLQLAEKFILSDSFRKYGILPEGI